MSGDQAPGPTSIPVERALALAKDALKPFARAAGQIPDDLPDDLWTSCTSYEYDMGEEAFEQLKASGVPLLSRRVALQLWNAERDPTRCEICDWPLADSQEKGCIPGDCSYRPDDPAEQARIRARRETLQERVSE